MTVAGEGADHVPADGDNLALRAVRALRKTITARDGVAPEAGPGGRDGRAEYRSRSASGYRWPAGSRAVARTRPARSSPATRSGRPSCRCQDLCEVAGRVGSDVAFAVLGGTAVGRGRGEQLTQALVAPVTFHWVLAFADGPLSTPAVYGALDRLRGDAGVGEPELSAELMTALRAGDADRLGAALSNDLQAPALAMFPALRKTLAAGREFGALGALVSGSGPTCFFLARDERHATDLAVALSSAGVCRSVVKATGAAHGASVVARLSRLVALRRPLFSCADARAALAEELGELEPAFLEGLDVGFERADLLHALGQALVIGVVVGGQRVLGVVDLVGELRQAALDARRPPSARPAARRR